VRDEVSDPGCPGSRYGLSVQLTMMISTVHNSEGGPFPGRHWPDVFTYLLSYKILFMRLMPLNGTGQHDS
jgi:hypothetical protein